jgi:3-hydroxybutyrate dehydrogenase
VQLNDQVAVITGGASGIGREIARTFSTAGARVLEAFGRLDVLVSNASLQIIAPLEELSFGDWKRLLAAHLDGAFLTTRAVALEGA